MKSRRRSRVREPGAPESNSGARPAEGAAKEQVGVSSLPPLLSFYHRIPGLALGQAGAWNRVTGRWGRRRRKLKGRRVRTNIRHSL